MKKGEFCPLIQKKCVENKCAWYTQVRGTNPNTGQEVDEWKCAVSWMPMMAVEIAQKSNQTGAAVESFRNEVVNANHQNQKLYAHALQQGIVQAQVTPYPPIDTLPPGQG
jgi:predicted Ser/Thr protein kinase